MTRVRCAFVMAMALVLATAFVADAAAQGPRPGFGMGGRGSLLGLLRIEQVQKELKLNEEQVTKAREVGEKLWGEMREQFAPLREIEDRAERRAKMTELTDQFDRKAREGLRDLLDREQMRRLYQIRMQVRSAVDSLANRRIARRLELTEEQQAKLTEISKDVQAKRSELFSGMREATQEQRTEMFEKFRKLRSDSDEKALGVLTDQQKEAFEKMKGEKIELPTPTRRGRQ